jgi:hypothetical protein
MTTKRTRPHHLHVSTGKDHCGNCAWYHPSTNRTEEGVCVMFRGYHVSINEVCDSYEHGKPGSNTLEPARPAAIELAILAERERCARIAESHPGACQTACDTGAEIAESIREAKTWCCRSKSLPHGQN